MTKTTSAAMDTHLLSEVTSLATATVIERTDGQKFRLTSSSEPIAIDIGDGDGEQTYSASEGVSRTNIENDSELNVDNLDILGVFDNAALQETELRRGLFDFAEFKIFVFNHQDTTDGIVKIFRGQLGEVIVTSQGFFKVTVRSIVQVYSKETGEEYSKDCRADLGDIRCTVPLLPDQLPASTAVTAGDIYLIPTTPDINPQIIMNFEGANGATSGPGFVNLGTAGDPNPPVANARISTSQAPAGGDSTSSLFEDGNLDRLFWEDDASFTMGSNEVTIHTHFRLASLDSTTQIIASHSDTFDRSWALAILGTSDLLQWITWEPGGTVIDVNIVGTTALLINTDYHVAATRDSTGDWRLFLGGTQEGSTATPAGDPHNSSGRLYIGATKSSASTSSYFHGWIDSFELFIGSALWTANFTPPVGNLSAPAPSPRIWEDYADRAYEVTIAGTTGPNLEVPDTTVGNSHTQGTATLKAFFSWMRLGIVTAVSGSDARRIFTVTELTPNSGQTVGANRLPATEGFPDDWFNGGAVLFESGNNAGRAIEVRDFTADDGVTITQDIELITDMPFDVEIGDKLRIFPGCDKTSDTCINKFNNAINAVAEWFVPGEDILGQYPDAR